MLNDTTVPPIARVNANAGVLRYLADGAEPGSVTVERPTEATDTWRLGAHPDIVERLWTELDAALPDDTRILVAGGAALAHPGSGAILAVALGTQYAIRLTDADFADATSRGYRTAHHFRTVDRHLDLAATFGPGWVIGGRGADEERWLRATYDQVPNG